MNVSDEKIRLYARENYNWKDIVRYISTGMKKRVATITDEVTGISQKVKVTPEIRFLGLDKDLIIGPLLSDKDCH